MSLGSERIETDGGKNESVGGEYLETTGAEYFEAVGAEYLGAVGAEYFEDRRLERASRSPLAQFGLLVRGRRGLRP